MRLLFIFLTSLAFLTGLLAPLFSLSRTHFSGGHVSIGPEHMERGDTLAWSLMAVLAVTLSLVGGIVWGLCRPFRQHPPESLAEEVSENPAGPAPPAPAGTRSTEPAPWEKPADWWKQDSPD